MAEKSGFTDKEVADYLKRRNRPDFGQEAQKRECIHCGNPYPAHEGGGGLCDYCLHKD